MKKQWSATALVMALGLAAPVLAQDNPLPPRDDSTPPQMQTPPDTGRSTGTQAPADKGSSAARAQAAQQANGANGEEYVVQKGDTLSRLAERFLGSANQWKQIADANAIQNPNVISVGMKLNIPQSGQGSTGDHTLERGPKSQPATRDQGTPGSSSAPSSGSDSGSRSTYPENR